MTIREEFEAWAMAPGSEAAFLERVGSDYAGNSVQLDWECWQAAYAAGQRADTELLQKALEALQFAAAWMPESAAVGEVDAVAFELTAALRNRKEQAK